MKPVRIASATAVLCSTVVFCCAVVSCAEPTSEETFVKTSHKNTDGQYVYHINMQDSTCVYNLSFFTKVDCPEVSFASLPDIRLDIRFVSPSRREYEETVWILKDNFTFREENSTDYNLPYRTGFVPVEYGVWDMYVTVPEENMIRGFRGLGLQAKKSWDGER